jgi:hypothetical protein
VKYNKKETLRSITPLREENSTLTVDSEDEEEEEVWVEAEKRSSATIAHNQDTLQGNVRTLAQLAATAACLNML